MNTLIFLVNSTASVVVPDLGTSSRWQSTLALAALTLIDGIPIYQVRLQVIHSSFSLITLSYFLLHFLTSNQDSL